MKSGIRSPRDFLTILYDQSVLRYLSMKGMDQDTLRNFTCLETIVMSSSTNVVFFTSLQ